MIRKEMADELVAMAEEDLADQSPLAALYDNDARFRAWVERVVVSGGQPLTVARWYDGEPPAELTRIQQLADRHDLRLAEIVADVGWPGRTIVGEDGADAAWALAQHADRHRDLRRGWLRLLQRAVTAGEADPRHLARLIDRVAMVDGQPQAYGTYAVLAEKGIVHWQCPADGSLADVDARRAELGLPPLLEDLAEPPEAAPYRWMRITPAYAWPRANSRPT